mmetsp:Transcript_20702/g.33472  ORF Transcript_20702/g.33472 Transcript_20702/m.33472 type:complete len:472 (+) Transcript_20702:74-1489(+)
MSQMPADVQKRIRALPGNSVCVDCSNVNPQWASVSYGTMMCLECSGHHRSLGVHLSFVRSVAMDSWTEKQIQAMEKSGGNQKLVDYFEQRNIPKTMQISTKYNTKQAEFYRNRLSRWLEGKTEPPPDPGRYDPVMGNEAQGAEPLPGETTDEYNARQARLREAARERMRAKFGGGGMGGIGSDGQTSSGFGSDNNFGNEGGGLGGLVSGVGSFLKNNVIENENLRAKVGGAVKGVGSVAGSAYDSLKQSEKFGGVTSAVGGAVGGLLGKAGEKLGYKEEKKPDLSKFSGMNYAEQEAEFWNSQYMKREVPSQPSFASSTPSKGFDDGFEVEPTSSPQVSSPFKTKSSPAVVNSKAKATSAFITDDDWGDFDDDFSNPKPEKPKSAPTTTPTTPPVTNGSPKKETSPEKAPAQEPLTRATTAPPVMAPSTVSMPPKKADNPVASMSTAPVAAPKKAPVKLQEADDFFADFGL